jgi:hypothetical protein
MKQWLVNDEIEIDAPDLSTAYEVANEMGLEIESIESCDEDYDGQPDELTEWMDFDPDC